jgi:hypothetical protein
MIDCRSAGHGKGAVNLAMELAVIAGALACFIGWHASKAHMSHRGIPVRRNQLRSFRRDRMHHMIWFLGFGVVFLLLLALLLIH